MIWDHRQASVISYNLSFNGNAFVYACVPTVSRAEQQQARCQHFIDSTPQHGWVSLDWSKTIIMYLLNCQHVTLVWPDHVWYAESSMTQNLQCHKLQCLCTWHPHIITAYGHHYPKAQEAKQQATWATAVALQCNHNVLI